VGRGREVVEMQRPMEEVVDVVEDRPRVILVRKRTARLERWCLDALLSQAYHPVGNTLT
jgi:hypothetical protein